MPEMINDPIEFELFKNSLFSIADEMALTIFRTTLFGRAEGQYGLLDRDVRRVGQTGGAGADFARPSRLDADGGDPEGLRRQNRAGRRVHPERPVSGRHAFAGHLRLQTDFLWQGASRMGRDGVPPHRCRWASPGLERVGLDRHTPRGAAP